MIFDHFLTTFFDQKNQKTDNFRHFGHFLPFSSKQELSDGRVLKIRGTQSGLKHRKVGKTVVFGDYKRWSQRVEKVMKKWSLEVISPWRENHENDHFLVVFLIFPQNRENHGFWPFSHISELSDGRVGQMKGLRADKDRINGVFWWFWVSKPLKTPYKTTRERPKGV